MLIPIILWFSLLSMGAEAPPAYRQPPGSELTVSLMTIAPGKAVYLWWGHIGLVVEDKIKNSSYFYDFGNFSFDQDNFYLNFAMGRLYYLSIKTRTEPYLLFMEGAGRRTVSYELNLTNREKIRLLALLEEGVLPENRTYLYHHYENNCSTRIRDLLDDVTGGELSRQTQEAALTYRDQANRFMTSFWVYLLLNYLQGSVIDGPISHWDAQFLPRELETFLESGLRENGQPLVNSKRVELEGRPFSVPPVPPYRLGEAFLWGFLLGALTLLIRLGQGGRVTTLWRLITPLLIILPSGLLFFMAFFTDHDVTRGNLNLLVTCPLLLVIMVPAILYSRSGAMVRLYHGLWDFQTLTAGAALLCQLLPGIGQDNGAMVLFFLPLYLAWGRPGTLLVHCLNRFKETPRCLRK